MPRRTLVILNTQAARAARTWPIIEKLFAHHKFDFELHQTTHAGDAESRTREALRAGYAIIAVVGGDGTLSEVASGFFSTPNGDGELPLRVSETAAMAVLPSGTGNDFARGLLKRRASLDDWINRLINYSRQGATSEARLLDVLYGSVDAGAKNFICLNAATLGIGAEVATLVAAQNNFTQRLFGEVRFGIAALHGARALA
ncbi:MAG: diacylglycerol kinase family protein [Pyrinomonadaceae bacterium]